MLNNFESEKISMERGLVSARVEIEKLIQKIGFLSQQIREKQTSEMSLKDRADQLQNVDIA